MLNICVCASENNAYPETFIRAHVTRLKGNVSFVFGGFFPTRKGPGGEFLMKIPGAGERIRRFALKRLFKHDFSQDKLKQDAFYDYLKNERIDVVLAEYGPTGAQVMDVCRRAGVTLVVHFHGFDAYRKNTLDEYRLLYPKMFEAAHAIVCVSRHMEEQLLKMNAPREKLFYNPCGGDMSLFQGSNPAQSAPLFISTGRFVDKKAPHLTLLAFARVLPNVPDARLIMVGDGPLLDAGKSLVKALGIAHAVKFPGALPHQDVAGLMRQARAFVQHSITPESGDSEGTPVAVSEAGGSGLPVIATRHGGIPDVVVDGVTGYLVDECDVDTMSQRMTTLAKDPNLAARMGQEARARVLAQFTLEKTIAVLDDIIEKADLRRKGYEKRTV